MSITFQALLLIFKRILSLMRVDFSTILVTKRFKINRNHVQAVREELNNICILKNIF